MGGRGAGACCMRVQVPWATQVPNLGPGQVCWDYMGEMDPYQLLSELTEDDVRACGVIMTCMARDMRGATTCIR